MRIKWAALLLPLLLCSGCQLMQQPQSYMRLPKLPAEQEALKATIERTLPAGAVLIRPRKVSGKGMIPLVDLDGDGREEAVFFYKTKINDQIHGEVWKQSAEGWQSFDKFEGAGSELDSLQLEDVTHDGKPDVIAAYATSSLTSPKGLAVYSMGSGKLTKAFDLPFTELVIDDLNGDGVKDMTVIELKERGLGATATLYQYDNGLAKLGSVSLAAGINGYINVVAGKVTKDRRGVVLDSALGAHSSQTELIVFDQGGLRSVLDTKLTMKAYTGKSEDADRDGILEIAGMRAPLGYENKALAVTPWIYTFAKWDGAAGLTPVLERYANNDKGYELDIPEQWKQQYTLEVTDTSATFWTYPERKRLAEIRTVPVKTWTDNDAEWTVLRRTADKVYAVNRDAAGLADRFRLLSEMNEGT
ncbi:hypothetical protein FPZ49_28070 [Paenibacillus cremeus]|uniref:VCBS repeat-containing protein n=2 Tax=Paenibacillus cremeus TaxID=2163881 RepID=A0A559K3J7_9BACL|nr:hypothetical protein FPZ49_28070 [Paenibacillus cremeus]